MHSLGDPTHWGAFLCLPADSLDAYCSKKFGYLCMDTILDPACPALFRQNNAWMAATGTAQLCDLGCLKAMCRLQEQAKTSVTGACIGCCIAEQHKVDYGVISQAPSGKGDIPQQPPT